MEELAPLTLPRLNLTWLVPPPGILLPTIAVTIFEDDRDSNLRSALAAWTAQWRGQLGIAERHENQQCEDIAANGSGYLFIILGDQKPQSVEQAVLAIHAASELGFAKIILAVRGDSVAQEVEPLARRCAITVLAEDDAQLLNPLRLLLSHEQLIGYDLADVFDIWRDRIGRVIRVDSARPEILSRFLSGQRYPTSGTVLLMMSNAEGAFSLADAIGSLVQSSRGESDFLWAMNRHNEGMDRVEIIDLIAQSH